MGGNRVKIGEIRGVFSAMSLNFGRKFGSGKGK